MLKPCQVKPFRTAAVLGAGVMGTQIAAHLANAGLQVYLLDLPGSGDRKNQVVEMAFKKGLQQTPPIFFTAKTAQQVVLGNFEDDFDHVAEVDWVLEAVVERLDIKQQLMARLEGMVRPDTVVSTNTSGLPIHAIVEGRSEAFRRQFLGTHFFNPPRYLKLLELIPTQDTDPQLLERMEAFGRLHLGKGIVIAKDTPNFIANRIGMFAIMLGLRALLDQDYVIEEIDALTGTLVGRPKSATFRTADLVGLDTILHVVRNLYPMIPEDESREMFQVPDLLQQLVDRGSLGAKTGQGFYQKVQKQILSLNPQTLAYESPKPMHLGDLEGMEKHHALPERLQLLYRDTGRAGQFFRSTTLKLLNYSAHRIPEIADSPGEIDRAMRWGFGWEMGPFEMWEALGFAAVVMDMRAAGLSIPDWVNDKFGENSECGIRNSELREGSGFEVQGKDSSHLLSSRLEQTDEINLMLLKSNSLRTLWQNEEAALLDLGDGVVLYEFRSKANTLSLKVMEGFGEVLDLLENSDFEGMVIGNDGVNFSVGVNLAEMGKLAQQGRFNPFAKRSHSPLANVIEQFQTLLQRIHYFPKPIVPALQGRVLGGGCELAMACPQVVAAAESYIGLVELGVGLIPAGGGTMRMVAWSAERAATETPSQIQPFLYRAFETLGTAKVSNSAQEAKELGFLAPTARVVMNADRRLYVAKEEVLRLAHEGYVAPIKHSIRVLGNPARAQLEHAAYVMTQGGFISDYDRHLASQLAYVMTGGDLSAPAWVDEDYLLQLEREVFLPLLDQKKTQERIMHMLKTKKPLRN